MQAFFKAKPLSGSANNVPHASSEAISQAFYKDKALSGGAKIDFSGEVNASHACSARLPHKPFTRLKHYLTSLKQLLLAKLTRPMHSAKLN